MIAGFAAIIAEIFTPAFLMACLSVGCFFASAAAGLQYSMNIQWVVFSIGTILSFFTVRPLALKYFFKQKEEIPTNANSMVGMNCTVVDPITNGEGTVKIYGEVWRAETENTADFPSGTKLKILRVESATLIVSE